MRWRVRNLTTLVEGYTTAEARGLESYLSYVDRAFRPGTRPKEKRISLFTRTFDDFPTGFCPQAWRAAQEDGLSIEVVDERVRPCEPDPDADLEWLRHHPAVEGEITHEVEAVAAATAKKRGIIWVPTGGGKTEIAIGLTRSLPCRWLFLVHTVDLLQQTADRYTKRTGLKAGIVGDGRYDVPDDCTFVVAGFQAIHRGLEDGRADIQHLVTLWAQGLAVDECHSLGASTHLSTVMQTQSAYYRVGFSGTPLARGDNRNLLIVGALGPVIYRIKPQLLIKLGLLAQPKIRMVRYQHKPEGKTWRGVYSKRIVSNTERNRLVVDVVQRAEKPCMVFVNHVKHGRDVVKRLEKAGLNARFAYGAKSTVQRKELLVQLERGYLDALVCNNIFDVGIDVPSLRSVVIASGMKSPIATVQRMGRGMRAEKGKDSFEVWDIADVGCGCADNDLPVEDDPFLDDPNAKTTHDPCRWLEKHMRSRRASYRKEGYYVEEETAQLSLGLTG